MTSKVRLDLEEAYSYCKDYRKQHKVRLFSQCWGCVKYSKEDPNKMCFFNPPNNDGCGFVNELARHNKEKQSTCYFKVNISD
jgi:hypothetical protein